MDKAAIMSHALDSIDQIKTLTHSLEAEFSSNVSSYIEIPRMFCLMDLPTEIRLKILKYLLILSEEIIFIDASSNGYHMQSPPSRPPPTSDRSPNVSWFEFLQELDAPSNQSLDAGFTRPYVSILQTCKRLNEEGTPLLYGQHTFTITLGPDSDRYIPPLEHQNSAIFLSILRWSTISQMKVLNFQISSDPTFQTGEEPRAIFKTTSADLLVRFPELKLTGLVGMPSENDVLSLSSLISRKISREKLILFHREMKDLGIYHNETDSELAADSS